VASFYGLLGAAAVYAVRADFVIIDATVLSGYEGNILRRLAKDYTDQRNSEETLATRVTLFRLSIVWLIVGGLAGLATWFLVGPGL
jgi:hypothetical protein